MTKYSNFSKLSNSNHEFKAFSFVLHSFKTFIEKYNPDKILFITGGADDKRTKVYLKLLLRYLSGYTFTQDGGEFVLTKNNLNHE